MLSDNALSALAAIDTASIEAFKLAGSGMCLVIKKGSDAEALDLLRRLLSQLAVLESARSALKREEIDLLSRQSLRWQLERSLEEMR